MDSRSVSQESLENLRREVASLEKGITIAIKDLEKEFLSFEKTVTVSLDDSWSTSPNTIEIYTFDPVPPLKDSIRQIFLEDNAPSVD